MTSIIEEEFNNLDPKAEARIKETTDKIKKLLKEHNNRPPKCACHNNGKCHGC